MTDINECSAPVGGGGDGFNLKLLITNNETHNNSFRTALNLFKELLIIFCALLKKKRFGSTLRNGLFNACIPAKENMYDT